jgi:hypothetical protein
MIRIPGQPGKDLCDAHLGVTRRDILRVGGSGLLGLTLGGAFQARALANPSSGGGPGWGAAGAGRAVSRLRRSVEERLQTRERLRLQTITPPIGWQRKTIDSFRFDPRYAGDGNRIDLAYAVYALSHGATEAEVAAAIRTRDLSKKGAEHRQQDYVERTIRKAGACLLEPSRGR